MREKRYERIYLPVRSREKLQEQLAADGFPSIPDNVTPLIASAPDWGFADLPVIDHVVHSAGVIFARTWEEYERKPTFRALYGFSNKSRGQAKP